MPGHVSLLASSCLVNTGESVSLTNIVPFAHGVILDIARMFCGPGAANVGAHGGGGDWLPLCSEKLRCSRPLGDLCFRHEDPM